jgi:hypothetical protein
VSFLMSAPVAWDFDVQRSARPVSAAKERTAVKAAAITEQPQTTMMHACRMPCNAVEKSRRSCWANAVLPRGSNSPIGRGLGCYVPVLQ